MAFKNKGTIVGHRSRGGTVLSQMSNTELSIPEIQVEGKTIDSLITNIRSNIQANTRAKNAGRCWFVWGAQRQAEKQMYAVDQQRQILAQLELLEQSYYQAGKVEAAKFLAPYVAKAIVENLEREVQLAWKQFEIAIYELDSQKNRIDAGDVKEYALAEQERGKAGQEKAMANKHQAEAEAIRNESYVQKIIAEAKVKIMTQEAKEKEVKVEYMKKVLSKFDIEDMSNGLKVLIVSFLFNGDATDLAEAELNELLKDFVVQEKEADAAKATQDARSVNLDNELKEHKLRSQVDKDKP